MKPIPGLHISRTARSVALFGLLAAQGASTAQSPAAVPAQAAATGGGDGDRGRSAT
jgi:hypothetical protein